MSASLLYRHVGGYVVTPEGHEDLVHAEVCNCVIRLSGLLIECPECGTVYGYIRDQSSGAFAANRKPD